MHEKKSTAVITISFISILVLLIALTSFSLYRLMVGHSQLTKMSNHNDELQQMFILRDAA